MQKIVFTIILMIFGGHLFSQSSIKIYTELEEETAQFMVWLNDDSQDAYPSDEVVIESLLPGKYTLKVSFNSDTIADWVKTIKIAKNQDLIYKVVTMKDIGKDIGKVGRGFGTMAGKTGENDSDDLVQYYKLEKQ